MNNKSLLVFIILLLAATGMSAQKPLAKHVIFIGLDGMAGNQIEKAEMPFFKNLMREGAWTLKKRSVLPSSSAVNWATLFMGAGSEIHGYLQWDSRKPDMQQPDGSVVKHNIFPTIFQIARDQHPKANLAVMAEWDGIKYVVDTLSLNKFELLKYEELAPAAVRYLKENKPELMAIVFDHPDHPGHDTGWGSPEYMETLHELDGKIAEIFKGIEEAGIIDDTMVVITVTVSAMTV